MAWSVLSNPVNKKYIVGHTDLDGIARAAAVKAAVSEWADAGVIIVYSRKIPATMPNTLPDALSTYIAERVPTGSEVLFEDIPVDVHNPGRYISALRDFCQGRACVWTDHHETDAPYLPQVSDAVKPNGKALWFGPDAYDYTLALVQWLGGDTEKAKKYAILTGIGDRNPKVVQVLPEDELREWLRIADGLDVIIREISGSSDPAEYGNLVENLATIPDVVFAQARAKADLIPTPSNYEVISPTVVLVTQALHPAWGPKSLERAALRTGTLYAIGYSPNPRDGTFAVRAITYWVAMAKNPSNATPIGMTKAFQDWLARQGRRAFGPPAAPVVAGYTSEAAALAAARDLANALASERYEPTTVHLVNDRAVAQALASDFSAILNKLNEILEKQTKMYEEYLELKKKQVQLLESRSHSDSDDDEYYD